jgi:hypothetical protein
MAAFAAALVMAGCGGAGGGDEATLSKAEFIKRADAICTKADETQIGEFGAYLRAHPGTGQKFGQLKVQAKVLKAIAYPSILKEVEDIEALGVPTGDEKTIDALIAAIKTATKEAEKDPRKSVAELPNGKNPTYSFRKVEKLGNEYGFNACDEIG